MVINTEKLTNQKHDAEKKLENVNSLLEKVFEEKQQLESNFNKVMNDENL